AAQRLAAVFRGPHRPRPDTLSTPPPHQTLLCCVLQLSDSTSINQSSSSSSSSSLQYLTSIILSPVCTVIPTANRKR
ncbi:hypothetical protein C7212DRAFT_308605, partial [Tuber magnatum]